MGFKSRIFALVLGFVLLVLMLLGVGWWVKGLLLDETDAAYQQGITLSKAVDKGRSAQVNFQRQVQEWKNVLIRGADQKLYNKYWAGFEKREDLMQSELQELEGILKTVGGMEAEIKLINSIKKTHAGLGEKYRNALGKHQVMGHEPQQIIDVEVRGIDRATSKNMDALVEQLRAKAIARFKADEKATRDRVEQNYLIGALLALLATAVLGVFALLTARKVVDILGADPEVAVQATARIASGDLTERLNATDPSSLIGSLEMMQSRLRNISLAIREVAFDIETRVQGLSQGAERDLLRGDLDRLRGAIGRLKINR